ncbi:uncharacterized protein LOC110723933 [Chenopodium quinoa]|uniref:uncharacterized protein LOC110723933 n=1 Tax=Chenopodium quinoa TaxID=63459 RepID=UPI000B791FC0|nr:uncharacterized protein LOC110723933 [Chenopodium quinoa]
MDPVNIRLYYGGRFVTKNRITTYEKGESNYVGLSLHPNVEEVCYFEFVDWIKRELGYEDVGQIWFRRYGCSLFAGRKEIKSDVDIPEFLQSKEKDGWYNMYVVHEQIKEKEKEFSVQIGMSNNIDSETEVEKRKLVSFMLRVRREVKVEVGYYKCYYARQKAMRMIYGDAANEYNKVWDYAEAIRHFNPGSTAIVKVTGIKHPPVLFQRMYICLQPCKQGFMAGCRPILGVDGCHLKGPYPGILLTAVGKDGNNNIFPVANGLTAIKYICSLLRMEETPVYLHDIQKSFI